MNSTQKENETFEKKWREHNKDSELKSYIYNNQDYVLEMRNSLLGSKKMS